MPRRHLALACAVVLGLCGVPNPNIAVASTPNTRNLAIEADEAVAAESTKAGMERQTYAESNSGKEAIVLLYKAADTASAQRTDEGVSNATHILESALDDAGYQVMQPDADTQAILDQGPRAIVTFAADAGLSVMLSAKQREIPIPGDPRRVQAEFSLNARVYCGSVMQPSPPEVSGKITALRTSLGKGYEYAAKRAATQLSETLRADLKKRGTTCVGALERMIRDYRVAQKDTAVDSPNNHPRLEQSAPAQDGPLPAPKKIWALLVGVSNFAEARQKTGWKIGDLAGVRGDMELMRKTLLGRGIPAAQITVLQDKAASASNFRQQLRTLQMKAGSDDLVLVYLSSHGMPADIREASAERPSLSGYGLPVFSDFNPGDANTILDFWEIQSLLLNTRAQQVVWMVDTCHAGGAALGLQATSSAQQSPGALPMQRVQLGARGLHRVEPAAAVFDPRQVAQAAGQIASHRHFAVLSAATPEQYALELGNGLFTGSVAQGLKQSKAPISIEQLFREHVQNQVREAALKLGQPQQPVFGKSGRGGEIRL